jgi:hypothetical protein
MKKILFACDGDHFSRSAFDFAENLNRHEKILLKGLFLPSIDYAKFSPFAYAASYERFMPADFFDEEEKIIDQNERRFTELCNKYNVPHSTSKYTGFESLAGLVEETRFSDLLLLDSIKFFSAMDRSQPNLQMSQVLHDTECPALLLPKKYEEPQNLIFAYDGEASCMAAIKQLSMLMPVYSQLPLTVTFVSLPGEEMPNRETVMEYLKCHYENVIVKIVDSENIENFDNWMGVCPSPLMVTGSYSRSGVSRIFRKSFSSPVIATHLFPIFLFHHK